MRTIDLILKEANYTHDQLYECEKNGICNGMGSKGGIQWTNIARKLPLFKKEKEAKLLNDLDLVSDIHDIDFATGIKVKHFLRANYNLSIRILRLLRWTTPITRGIVFMLVFGGTTMFGWRTFNFK